MQTFARKFGVAIASFSAGAGLEVSGYENWQVAIGLWAFATIWLVLALKDKIPKISFKGRRLSKQGKDNHNNEPEVSVQIDNCSVGNPIRIGNEPMRPIEVSVTLSVEHPPVNVTDLQLCVGGNPLRRVDSTPPLSHTQTQGKECYIAKYGISIEKPNIVPTNELMKYQLCVITMGRKWCSGQFLPKDFRHALIPDKGDSQTE